MPLRGTSGRRSIRRTGKRAASDHPSSAQLLERPVYVVHPPDEPCRKPDQEEQRKRTRQPVQEKSHDRRKTEDQKNRNSKTCETRVVAVRVVPLKSGVGHRPNHTVPAKLLQSVSISGKYPLRQTAARSSDAFIEELLDEPRELPGPVLRRESARARDRF